MELESAAPRRDVPLHPSPTAQPLPRAQGSAGLMENLMFSELGKAACPSCSIPSQVHLPPGALAAKEGLLGDLAASTGTATTGAVPPASLP